MRLKGLIALAAAVGLFACAQAETDVRRIDAPETELQQALYDYAIEKKEALIERLSQSPPQIEWALFFSEPLYEALSDPQTSFGAPSSVLLLLPTEEFGEHGFLGNVESLPEALWASAGLEVVHGINESISADTLGLYLGIFGETEAREFPAGRGVAYAACVYEGEYEFGILCAVPLSETGGQSVCKASPAFDDSVGAVAFYNAPLMCFGEESFECVSIRVDAD